MPYKLRKAPNKELYWVITIETGKKHSKQPIPKEKAQTQLRILEAVELEGGVLGFVGKYTDMVQKDYMEAYKKNPTLPKLEDVRQHLNNKDLEWMVSVLSIYKTWDNYIQKAKGVLTKEVPVNLANFLQKRNAFTGNLPKMKYYLEDISLLLRAIPKSQYDMAEEAEKPAPKNAAKEQAAYMNLRKVYDQLRASGLSDAQVKANGLYLAAKKAFESAKSGSGICYKCGKEHR